MCFSIKTLSENNLHMLPSHTSDGNIEEQRGAVDE